MEFQSVLLFVLVVGFAESCDSSCYFIYDNRTGNVTRDAVKPWNTTEKLGDDQVGELVYRSAGGKLIGLITVKGGFHGECAGGSDYLRFRKSGEWNQPVVFQFDDGNELKKVSVYGECKNGTCNLGLSDKETVTDWKIGQEFDFQISDANVSSSPGFYNIYINKKNVQLNYCSAWDSYSDYRLNTADNIRSDLFCTHYTSIMICDTSQPKICSLVGPVKSLILGDSYTLTCKGAGSPILEVTWTKPDKSAVSGTETLNKDNDVITSTLEIQDYSTSDSGVYTCTVRNQNYGDEVTNTFDMTYTQEVIVTPPAVTYYKEGEGDTAFVWYITGWPLEEVKLMCNMTDGSPKEFIGTDAEKLFISKTATEDTFAIRNCIVYNGESMLDNLNITRVGFNCRTGYYGQGKDCLLCPSGQTSLAESDDLNNCYGVSSQCIAGDYGIDRVCSPCPDGKTSENYTVKEEDCFDKPGTSAAVIGGAAGGGVGLVVVLVVVLLVVLYIRKRSSSKDKPAETIGAIPTTKEQGKPREEEEGYINQREATSDRVCSQLDHHKGKAGEPGQDDGLYVRMENRFPHQEVTFSNLLAQDKEDGDALKTQIGRTPRFQQVEEGLYADQRPDFSIQKRGG